MPRRSFPSLMEAVPILRSFNEGEHGMVGGPVTAADPENDELFYSISGAHAAFFSVDASSGQLETKTGCRLRL